MFPSLLSSIDYCLIASIESGGDISQRGRVRERNMGMGLITHIRRWPLIQQRTSKSGCLTSHEPVCLLWSACPMFSDPLPQNGYETENSRVLFSLLPRNQLHW